MKWVEYVKMMQELELGIPTQQTELDLPLADDIRINDIGPVMRATANDNEIELTQMNFGLRPINPSAARYSITVRTVALSPTANAA